ncbi:MAG: hypothetical protein ACK55I_38545, partial [bacterium]
PRRGQRNHHQLIRIGKGSIHPNRRSQVSGGTVVVRLILNQLRWPKSVVLVCRVVDISVDVLMTISDVDIAQGRRAAVNRLRHVVVARLLGRVS